MAFASSPRLPLRSRRGRSPIALVVVGTVTSTLLAGCLHTVSVAIRRDQIGTKYARMSGYLSTRSVAPGGTHRETVPGTIRHDVLLDEATLAKVDAQETCVDLVFRTDSVHDEPIDQLKPTFTFDGVEARAVVERELVSVIDYSFTGVVEVASVQGVAADKFVGMSVTKPAERIFRVIERTARVCGGQGGAVSAVKLTLVHPTWEVGGYAFRDDFEWHLR
jgi:hypothetical protein